MTEYDILMSKKDYITGAAKTSKLPFLVEARSLPARDGRKLVAINHGLNMEYVGIVVRRIYYTPFSADILPEV